MTISAETRIGSSILALNKIKESGQRSLRQNNENNAERPARGTTSSDWILTETVTFRNSAAVLERTRQGSSL
jgi:hypothetical protein